MYVLMQWTRPDLVQEHAKFHDFKFFSTGNDDTVEGTLEPPPDILDMCAVYQMCADMYKVRGGGRPDGGLWEVDALEDAAAVRGERIIYFKCFQSERMPSCQPGQIIMMNTWYGKIQDTIYF